MVEPGIVDVSEPSESEPSSDPASTDGVYPLHPDEGVSDACGDRDEDDWDDSKAPKMPCDGDM